MSILTKVVIDMRSFCTLGNVHISLCSLSTTNVVRMFMKPFAGCTINTSKKVSATWLRKRPCYVVGDVTEPLLVGVHNVSLRVKA